ncbi:MAG: BrnT family toxin [Zoogloeaceae bacterium]|jgi:uncharacterized DUF497 family protein|nr:BrnT family toxin [Zoogloeaceae bacterium]
MKITFDPAKNRINIRKHGIDLSEVEGVFFDEFAHSMEDRDHAEARFVVLGTDGFGRLLVVAYAWRGEAEIRVISARRAEPHERRIYED